MVEPTHDSRNAYCREEGNKRRSQEPSIEAINPMIPVASSRLRASRSRNPAPEGAAPGHFQIS
jgi:hypothetical protein